ncbi:MAG: PhoH family protein [Bacteroidota bacterium]|nr:PhoH family protein [Bacteroidota bacterium]
MSEKAFEFDDRINPLDIFGAIESNIILLQNSFPKLKIILRGNSVKVIGDEDSIEQFEKKINAIISHSDKYGFVSGKDLSNIIVNETHEINEIHNAESDVLVHGRNGKLIKALTVNQKRMVRSIESKDMLFAIGPAGTGKTYTAVALAVRALKNKQVKRIILTRPAVEAGENLGFLPGDLKNKLDPYLQPLYDALRDMIPADKLAQYMEEEIIQIAPLAYMRGRTLDNAFAILDEGQNATNNQLKMFLTRMGKSAKFVVTGDITQIDLPRNQPSGLVKAIKILKGIKEIDFIFLSEEDFVRHKLVTKIVEAYQMNNEE